MTDRARSRPLGVRTKVLCGALLCGALFLLQERTAHTAPDPGTPPTRIIGYLWKRVGAMTPSVPGDVLAVAIENTSPATPSAHAAISASGKVDIYSYWTLPTLTKPSWNKDATINGRYVSMSGTRIAIGSPTYAAGSVRVYHRPGGVLTAMGPAITPASSSMLAMDFGRPVEIDGDVLVVGSPQFDFEGRAFVFEWQGGAWVQTAMLGNAPGQAYEESLLGAAVDVSGNLIAVGQTPDDAAGKVYLYEKQGGAWTLVTTLQARDPANPALPAAAGDADAEAFGKALVLKGNQLAVRSNGYLQVFERVLVGGVSQWTFQDSYDVDASNSSYHHRSIAFDGKNLLAGEYISPAVASPPGRVRPLRGPTSRSIFSIWTPDDAFIMDSPQVPLAQFGRTTATHNGWLVIGDKTHARIYQRTAYGF